MKFRYTHLLLPVVCLLIFIIPSLSYAQNTRHPLAIQFTNMVGMTTYTNPNHAAPFVTTIEDLTKQSFGNVVPSGPINALPTGTPEPTPVPIGASEPTIDPQPTDPSTLDDPESADDGGLDKRLAVQSIPDLTQIVGWVVRGV